MIEVVSQVGATVGAFIIVISLIGILFLTPFQRRWMYYIYSPIMLLNFAIMIALGLYINAMGDIGGNLIQDYCDDRFERWTKLNLGKFPANLDKHYSDLEKNLLCSKTCQCPKINFNLWTTSKLTSNINNIQVDYNSKYFTGNQQNVLYCLNDYAKNNQYFDYDVINYLTYIEGNHDCAGICQPIYFYTFTDIQAGPPTQSCRTFIQDDFMGSEGVFRRYSLIYFVAGAFVFMAWFFSFGICFRTEQKSRTRVEINK
ncbi:UNKNOWN [Stylonychia lemnae]|uniref:Tetraspanin family protein n=1 Tax=Stylonychia lemnae TaxID=5949 RepID=A0A078BB77_STYLE|nr:UNKNOWN [Stylonychia lemnae]|eukprot:CDW91446.1 UNKNOWN [Stylonychia lemnae]